MTMTQRLMEISRLSVAAFKAMLMDMPTSAKYELLLINLLAEQSIIYSEEMSPEKLLSPKEN